MLLQGHVLVFKKISRINNEEFSFQFTLPEIPFKYFHVNTALASIARCVFFNKNGSKPG